MGTAADSILEALQPVLTAFPDDTGTTEAFVGAVMAPSQIVDDVARDTDAYDAWGSIRDPDLAPASWLLWLAQHVGVRLPAGIGEAETRARIGESAGFWRGRVDGIVADIRRTLTGTQYVYVSLHHGGDPWAILMLVREDETADLEATRQAAAQQCPAWIVLTVDTTSTPAIIDAGSAVINDVAVPIDDVTIADVT
jgi:hypothetical protein